MTEQMYAPKAVLLVQEHVTELIECYARLRLNESQRDAVLHAFATVFTPDELTAMNQFIAGQSDAVLGEGTGARFVTDMETFFEERSQINESAEVWKKEYMGEVERRTTMDIVACAEAWATDEAAAVMCTNAYGNGDEETGNHILFGAAHMIALIAVEARTKTSKRVKLDQAIHVARVIGNKNSGNGAVVAWCQMLVSCLQQESAAL